jgi:hypothetical protein
MPRATRSKKIVIAEDDTDIATQIPLPDSPGKAPRFVLQEISHNPEPETMTMEGAELATQLKAPCKPAIGGKKNKKGRGKKKDKEPFELVVVEDDEPAVVSPAIAGARQILSSDEGSLMFLLRGMHQSQSNRIRGPTIYQKRARRFSTIASCARNTATIGKSQIRLV